MPNQASKVFSDSSTFSVMDSSQSLSTANGGSSLFASDFDSTAADSLTDSLFTTTTTTEADSDLKVTKEMIDRKQLQHDFELLRIELSQKNLMIDTMKAEYLNKIDEMEERLSDAIHQKQLVAAQLQAQLRTAKAEYEKDSRNLKQEIQLLLKQQKEMNLDNQKLMEKAIDSKDMLIDLELDEDDYLAIKGKHIEEQTLREFIAVSTHFFL